MLWIRILARISLWAVGQSRKSGEVMCGGCAVTVQWSGQCTCHSASSKTHESGGVLQEGAGRVLGVLGVQVRVRAVQEVAGENTCHG